MFVPADRVREAMTTTRPTEDATRRELYDLARQRRIAGRSAMTRDELLDALQPDVREPGGRKSDGREPDGREPDGRDQVGPQPSASRFEAFRDLARDRARGTVVLTPRLLTGNDRRLHVRETLREDHQSRITERCEDTAAKFDKLAGSLYSFFRGTCLLFYRDLAGDDATMPTVLVLGDVHPDNFGVMPSADNVPIFGVNDFDEAYYAPFTWDVKRGAVGFLLAAEEEGGHGPRRCRRIARHFVQGYVDGITEFARDGSEGDHQVRRDNAPALIRALFDDADEDRRSWLAEDYHDEFGRGFRADDELVPISSRREEFQELVDRLVAEQGITVPARAGEMRVKDVAMRKGQGTASLGLARYYVLVEGQRADATDDLVLEFKQARRSALAGLVPPAGYDVDGEGGRIAHAQSAQLVNGDVFYGGIEFEGRSFIAQERSPYRDDIDLDELSKQEWKAYARICGRALAHAHALSDESGHLDHDVEPQIVEAIGPPALFVDDMLRFADEAVDRLRRDHEHFRADHALGAFESVGVAYR
jgi:uncharacterized protein (DUF2252 family)